MSEFTLKDLEILCSAARYLPASERKKFGAVLNKLKAYIDDEDEFISDFNKFYDEIKRKEEVRKVVHEELRRMKPGDEVRMTANWYGDYED